MKLALLKMSIQHFSQKSLSIFRDFPKTMMVHLRIQDIFIPIVSMKNAGDKI